MGGEVESEGFEMLMQKLTPGFLIKFTFKAGVNFCCHTQFGNKFNRCNACPCPQMETGQDKFHSRIEK